MAKSIQIRIPIVSSLLFVLCAGTLLMILWTEDVISDHAIYAAITLLLISYLTLEVIRIRRRHPDCWLVHPFVMCSFITFVMGFGVTNVLFFMPADRLAVLGLVPQVSTAMVKLMWLALLGAVAMSLGYWSPIATRLSRQQVVSQFQKRFLPKSNSLRAFALPALIVISVGAKLIQVKLGIFGYSSNYEHLVEMGSVTQYLSMASGLGKLALVLAAFLYYSKRTKWRSRIWFFGLLAIEVIFGLFSGFKSAVIMPFIIVALSEYLRTGRVGRHWVMLAIFGLVVAYATIEPFRDARRADPDFKADSLSVIADTMISAGSAGRNTATEKASLVLAVASRSNLSYIGSFGIQFSDDHPELASGSPQFLKNIFWAPIYAWVPRIILPSKPLGNLGLWYTQVVMGKASFSATAMSPFTYLYLAGGAVAVFLGFFFLGAVQRVVFFLLDPAVSAAGGVVFLAVLATISVIGSSFDGLVLSLCREIPLLIVLQFLLFSPRKGGAKKELLRQLRQNRIPE